ncbi:hypothetical protein TRIUR3_06860 [Triticum urartu]|uniref:CASP-like protein n=2 Tax=Triticum TaxID=4564 RepID=A0A9R0RND3_TRITD|nr:hypothetical protein TRIUR3_06860 [Triticum urartu]VAH63773.1 unnamed protein product [Triticum turgidum subsp. durum]
MGSSAVPEPPTTSVAARCPRLDMAMVATRAAALVMALLSMSLMVSAKQRGSLIIFGIEIPLYAKWSLSDSLKSLVGLSAAAAAYSLAQLLSIAYKALKKVPVVPSRRYAWMLLAGDQEESPKMVRVFTNQTKNLKLEKTPQREQQTSKRRKEASYAFEEYTDITL